MPPPDGGSAGDLTATENNSLDDFGLLTVKQVAAILRCSKAHAGKVIDGRVAGCGAIPCVRLGRRKLVRRESLAGWLEHNETDKMGASPVRGARKALKEDYAPTAPIRGFT